MAEDLAANVRAQLATIMGRESSPAYPHVDYDALRARLAEITTRAACTPQAYTMPEQHQPSL
jgi:hypothetical protein